MLLIIRETFHIFFKKKKGGVLAYTLTPELRRLGQKIANLRPA